MNLNIGIINYGVGNVRSISNALKLLGIHSEICESSKDLANGLFEKIILPGVGSFDLAANELNLRGFTSTIKKMVSSQEIEILGICLGMQLLLEGSDEGELPGLGLIPGIAKKFNFEEQSINLPVPNMGWNSFEISKSSNSALYLEELEGARFYFAHSYYASDVPRQNVYATSRYGIEFPSVIGNEFATGFQFHPEKSLKSGLLLLRNFFQG